jgi:cellobiose transport system permease protein
MSTSQPVANARKRRHIALTSEGRRAGAPSYAFLTLIILLCLFPIYYAIQIASVTTDNMYGAQSFGSGHLSILWHNLQIAFTEMTYWHALWGSFLVSAICGISVVFFSMLAGYSFAKLRFRGSGPLFAFLIATMAIPTQLSVVPLYILMAKFGLFGKLPAVMIPGLVTAFGVFWMKQYLEQALPYELIEAAQVDGCSMISTFFHVAVPAARPVAAMLFLFTFVAQWTQYYWPFLILGSNNKAMLTIAMSTLRAGHFTDYTVIMAGIVLVIIPLLLLFVAAGKQLVAGVMAGAVKG